jgi:beta-N-acetylhexosaminidase
VDELPLRQQVGRLVVLRFAGTSAPGYVREVLGEGRAAGAILFRDNLIDSAQTKVLTAQLKRGAAGPPLICVDQEGGEIRILPWAAPERSQVQQAAAGTVRADAEAAARDLRAHGINVSLAPVADVASVPGAALAGRAFSTDFAAAGEAIAEAVGGWRAGGVAATVKHFPGLGGATVNTDDGPATIERSAAQLREQDLLPFRSAVEAGAPLVMAGHAVYPAVDPERIASQSQPVIEGAAARGARLPGRRDHGLDRGRRGPGRHAARGGGRTQRARGRGHRAHHGTRLLHPGLPRADGRGAPRSRVPGAGARIRRPRRRASALAAEVKHDGP